MRAHRGCFDRIGLRQSSGGGGGQIICFLLLFLFRARVIITVAAAAFGWLVVGGMVGAQWWSVLHAHTLAPALCVFTVFLCSARTAVDDVRTVVYTRNAIIIARVLVSCVTTEDCFFYY